LATDKSRDSFNQSKRINQVVTLVRVDSLGWIPVFGIQSPSLSKKRNQIRIPTRSRTARASKTEHRPKKSNRVPTWWRGGRVPGVRGHWAAFAAVAPLALASDVMTSLVNLGRTPGQVLRQVSLVPGALVVNCPIEPEREYAGQSGWRAADSYADLLSVWNQERKPV